MDKSNADLKKSEKSLGNEKLEKKNLSTGFKGLKNMEIK